MDDHQQVYKILSVLDTFDGENTSDVVNEVGGLYTVWTAAYVPKLYYYLKYAITHDCRYINRRSRMSLVLHTRRFWFNALIKTKISKQDIVERMNDITREHTKKYIKDNLMPLFEMKHNAVVVCNSKYKCMTPVIQKKNLEKCPECKSTDVNIVKFM